MTDLWPHYAPLISRVAKPSRYLGHERGAPDPASKPDADYHAVFMYPDTYEIGQTNQAIAILCDSLNSSAHILCERAYLPWVDMIELMREHDLPLASLESYAPLSEFDFVGITLPHEMAATNVLEALDLARIPLHAAERGEDDPLVFGGGPCTYNPEPFAAFFDAFFIGEGEEVDLEAALRHRELRDAGASRAEILHELALIDGVYVPSLYEPGDEKVASASEEETLLCVQPTSDDVPPIVYKRLMRDFDATDALPTPIVPYSELVHDRLSIEIMRGCARGCRFCQAGMMYRPVRERSPESIVEAALQGLACTGYDEVSLTSLSSTDYSRIAEVLHDLQVATSGTGTGISLPSLRVDAFGVELAQLVAGERKGGLTLAPEAGTQRLRDIINKGVTEDDLMAAVTSAFEAGWRRLKLYFMIGLPGETDEDVAGIGELCRRVYAAAKDAVPDEQRGHVRMSVSTALFIPKPCTPFQWEGQILPDEIAHRIEVLRDSMPRRGVDLHWHSPEVSFVEAALARGGRDCASLIEAAWLHGARFDAWTEQFDFQAWLDAGEETGLSVFDLATHEFAEDEPLPWSHISCGVSERFLRSEREKAFRGETTPDCTFGACSGCGACQALAAENVLQGERHG